MMKRKLQVFVGLSGGVDSAVSAALLKKEGYEVAGVFIKAWTPPGYPCTWREDRRSAMRACAVLDIPFITLNLEKEYKGRVVDYMINEYKKGRTPNPDVMCNKEIKFGEFLKWARGKGADFIATGHYCIKREIRNSKFEIREGKDKNKDQSYFLWTLTQDQLKYILFPVGGLLKPEVRRLAAKFGLPQAKRKDSQGLCFLGQVDMKEFLSQYIELKKGSVLNMTGEIIGHHNGALFFTLGERHGFTITNKTDKDRPLYAVEKDIKNNTITVAAKSSPHKFLGLSDKKVARICSENFFTQIKSGPYFCRYRYRQEKQKCRVRREKGKIEIVLEKLVQDLSPGQSIVFYKKGTCLGGGVIEKVR